ncbi:hypothetical protein GNZ12_26865 [Paraburkholderia sp. 1N]|uniref:Uncharacterized protein n=1 Tax=Paraburkholderia solitsugae TaxID=2675748 RepID=A0ABX2BVG7_9BURK|nr:hypothetical protein [Paraburkholderia solitsugae]NPT44874.1 hypothetical protein [Paraburkholderia solitsugae]
MRIIMFCAVALLANLPFSGQAETHSADIHVWSNTTDEVRVWIRDWNPDVPPHKGSFTAQMWFWDQCSASRRGISGITPSNPAGNPASFVAVRANFGRFAVHDSTYTFQVIDEDQKSDIGDLKRGDVVVTFEQPDGTASKNKVVANMLQAGLSGSTCPQPKPPITKGGQTPQQHTAGHCQQGGGVCDLIQSQSCGSADLCVP